MRLRWIPILAFVYFIAMAFAMTYPGYVPANRIRPFVFGLPFSLFWQVLWITGAIVVLGTVFIWEKRSSSASSKNGDPTTRSGSEKA